MKRQIDPILGERVRLRLLREDDLSMTLAWRNQDHIRKWFIHSDVILPEQHKKWFQSYLEKDNDFVFIIEEIRDLKKPIGQVSLYNINWTESKAEFGRLLIGEDDARRKGFPREATRLLLNFGFNAFDLVEIELEVKRNNVSSISLYELLGFIQDEDGGDLVVMRIRNDTRSSFLGVEK